MLTAYFYNKSTWAPLTNPNVTVKVTLANMNQDARLLDEAIMSPSSSFPWAFRFNYEIDSAIDYMAYYSCSDSNYVAQVDKLFIPSTRWWGWSVSINYGAINSHTTKKFTELAEKIKDYTEEFNEIKSHITDTVESSTSEIVSKVDSIEIPETEEKEAKKALKIVTTLDQKLTSYIESEREEKAKEAKEKEEISALAMELTKLDMEEELQRKEKEAKDKEEMEKKRKEQEKEDEETAKLLEMEFDKLDQEEIAEKRRKLIEELEDAEEEIKSLKSKL